jgi:hypothetical protein
MKHTTRTVVVPGRALVLILKTLAWNTEFSQFVWFPTSEVEASASLHMCISWAVSRPVLHLKCKAIFSLLSLFWKNKVGLWDHVAVCLCVCLCIPPPLIVARHRLGRNVTEVTNKQATIEELLDASFTMWPVSYRGKLAISSSQNFLLKLLFNDAVSNANV